MARSMLQEKSIPNTFWTKAVYTTVYFLKRCPTKAVHHKTPIETWRRGSSIWIYLLHIHVPNQRRHKLGDKAIRGIFLGYSTQSKGY